MFCQFSSMSPTPPPFKKSAYPVVSSTLNKNRNKKSDNNRRLPLPPHLQHCLTTHQFIILTDLNVNKHNELKKPLVHGTKVKLALSKQAIVNGMIPLFRKKSPRKDIRDDDSKKNLFLSTLNLVEAKKGGAKQQAIKKQSLDTSLEKRLYSRNGQVVTFFKHNPLPINSTLGQKIINTGFGKCYDKTKAINQYEKYCSSKMKSTDTQVHRKKLPKTNMPMIQLQKGQYVHTYSFGSTGRRRRYVELTVGMSERSFSLFNKCPDASVRLKRMTDTDIARKMMKMQSQSSSKVIQTQIIAQKLHQT